MLPPENVAELLARAEPISSNFASNLNSYDNQTLRGIMSDEALSFDVAMEEEEKKEPADKFQDGNAFERGKIMMPDSMSTLRFVVDGDSERYKISPSGLKATFNNRHNQQQMVLFGMPQSQETNMCLTNMSFSYGVHKWEIEAQKLVNQNLGTISIGVYNQILEIEKIENYSVDKLTKFIITLDLQKQKVYISQEQGAKMTEKTIDLQGFGGPWTPCVKTQDYLQFSLNPYLVQPSYQLTLNDWQISHFSNIYCKVNKQVNAIPSLFSGFINFARKLKKNLDFEFFDVDPRGEIHLLKKALKDGYENLGLFINLPNLNQQQKEMLQIIQEQVMIPKELTKDFTYTSENIKEMIQQAWNLISSEIQTSPKVSEEQKKEVRFIYQEFTDKLIAIKGRQVQILSRKDSHEQFDMSYLDFSKSIQEMNDDIQLRIELKYLEAFILDMKKDGLFTESNDLMRYFAHNFFSSLKKSARKIGEKVISFSVRFDKAWFFLEHLLKNSINNKQQEMSISSQHAVSCLLEQMWCKAKNSSQNGFSRLRSFVDSVSRPWSAFNRIGSFLCWEPNYEDRSDNYKSLADQGFVRQTLDGNLSLANQIEGPNRGFNVPLWKTSNYLSHFEFPNNLIDVIVAPNSSFTLFGLDDGTALLYNTSLPSYLPVKMHEFLSQYSDNPFFDMAGSRKKDLNKKKYEGLQEIVNVMQSRLGPNFSKQAHNLLKPQIDDEISDDEFKGPKIFNPKKGTDDRLTQYIMKIQKQIDGGNSPDVSDEEMQEQVSKNKRRKGKKGKNKMSLKSEESDSKKQNEQTELTISNIPLSAREEDIRATFIQFGNITKIMIDQTQAIQASVRVKYETKGDAQKACNIMNGKIFMGNTLQIEFSNSTKNNKKRIIIPNEKKVLGYFLLSEPDVKKASYQVQIGCVYFMVSTQTYYIKVNMLNWSWIYLQSMIDVRDFEIPLMKNNINDKYFINTNNMQIEDIHKEIFNLNYQILIDLCPIFIRGSTKKQRFKNENPHESIFDNNQTKTYELMMDFQDLMIEDKGNQSLNQEISSIKIDENSIIQKEGQSSQNKQLEFSQWWNDEYQKSSQQLNSINNYSSSFETCRKIIEFSHTRYSIFNEKNNEQKVFMLVEKKDGQQVLKQFSIPVPKEDQFININQNKKPLLMVKELALTQKFKKLIHIEDTLILLSDNSYSILNVERDISSASDLTEVKLPFLIETVTVQNKSELQFNLSNQWKFNKMTKDSQIWQLVINREHLIKIEMDNSSKNTKMQEAIELIDLNIPDLRALPQLLSTKALGIKGIENDCTHLEQLNQDKFSNLPEINIWTLIKPVSQFTLKAIIFNETPLSKLKIDFEEITGSGFIKVQSNDLILGEFPLPSDSAPIIIDKFPERQERQLHNLQITVISDNQLPINSRVTLTGQSFTKDQASGVHSATLQRSLLSQSFDDVLGQLLSLGINQWIEDEKRIVSFNSFKSIIEILSEKKGQPYLEWVRTKVVEAFVKIDQISDEVSKPVQKAWSQAIERIGLKIKKVINDDIPVSSDDILGKVYQSEKLKLFFEQKKYSTDELQQLLFEKIIKGLMPTYFTKDYLILKNIYNIKNQYPFDNIFEDSSEQITEFKQNSQQHLPCSIDFQQFSQLMIYNVDLGDTQTLDEIQLIKNTKQDNYYPNYGNSRNVIEITVYAPDPKNGMLMKVHKQKIVDKEAADFIIPNNLTQQSSSIKVKFLSSIISRFVQIQIKCQEFQNTQCCIYPVFFSAKKSIDILPCQQIEYEPLVLAKYMTDTSLIQMKFKVENDFNYVFYRMNQIYDGYNTMRPTYLWLAKMDEENIAEFDGDELKKQQQIKEKLAQQRKKLQDLLRAKGKKEEIDTCLVDIEKTKLKMSNYKDRQVNLSYIFNLAEEIADQLVKKDKDVENIGLMKDSQEASLSYLIKNFAINDTIINHPRIQKLMNYIEKNLSCSQLVKVLFDFIGQDNFQEYIKVIKINDLSSLVSEIISQLGLKGVQPTQLTVQENLQHLLIQSANSSVNQKQIFLLNVIQSHGNNLSLKEFMNLMSPVFPQIIDKDSIKLLIQTMASVKNEEMTDHENLTKVICKSIVLSKNDFKEILNSFKKLFEKVNLCITLENVKNVISSKKMVEKYRVSNLLQLITLSSKEEESQRFDSVLSIISDEKLIKKDRILFDEIWVELFTQAIQTKDPILLPTLINKVCQALTLPESNIEVLVPQFLTALENSMDPVIIFKLLNFLMEKDINHPNIQVIYRFVLGITNIMQTGKKNVTDTKMASLSIPNNEITLSLFNAVVKYLTEHQLDETQDFSPKNIVVSHLFNFLQQAKLLDKPGTYAFLNLIEAQGPEDLIVQRDQVLNKLFRSLLQNTEVNVLSKKPKYIVEAQIKAFLSFIKDPNCTCISVLVEVAREINHKIFEATHQAAIESEDGDTSMIDLNQSNIMMIQRYLNKFVLEMFNQWMNSDEQVRRFLLGTTGFQFLIDHIRSKRYQDDLIIEEFNKQQLNQIDQQSDEEEKNMVHQPPAFYQQNSYSSYGEQEDSYGMPQNNLDHQDSYLEDNLTSGDLKSRVEAYLAQKFEFIQPKFEKRPNQLNEFQQPSQHQFMNQLVLDKINFEQVNKYIIKERLRVNQIRLEISNYNNYRQSRRNERFSEENKIKVMAEGSSDLEQWAILLKCNENSGILEYYYSFDEDTGQYPLSIIDLESLIYNKGQIDVTSLQLRFNAHNSHYIKQNDDNQKLMHIDSRDRNPVYQINTLILNCYKPCPPKSLLNYITDQQNDLAEKLLKQVFKSQFSENLFREELLVAKIKENFSKLIQIISYNGEFIKPFLLQVCRNNTELGDWIINQHLLQGEIDVNRFALLKEIIENTQQEQHLLLFRLKDFIFMQAKQQDVLTEADTKMLSKYIKLYKNQMIKLESNNKQQIVIEVQETDIDNLVRMLGKSLSFSLQNKLIYMIMQLIYPKAPFINKNFSPQAYINKLQNTAFNHSSHLLFLSVFIVKQELEESQDEFYSKIIQNSIIVDKLIKELSTNPSTSIQVLYNLSKVKPFLQVYSEVLPAPLINFLNTQFDIIPDYQVNLLVDTITTCVFHSPTQIEFIASKMRDQLLQNFSGKDKSLYLQRVISPLLQAEEKLAVSLTLHDNAGKSRPVTVSQSQNDKSGSNPESLFKTEILTSSQQATLARRFKEISGQHIDKFSENIQDNDWDQVYANNDFQHVINREDELQSIIDALQNKKIFFLIIKCKQMNQRYPKTEVFGLFTDMNNSERKDQFQNVNILNSKASFMFQYSDKEQLHFKIKENINNPNNLYFFNINNTPGNKYLQCFDQFINIQFPQMIDPYSHFFDSMGQQYQLQCLDKDLSQNQHTGRRNYEVKQIEIWCPNNNQKDKQDNENENQDIQVSKSNKNYCKYSPLNYFNEHMIFEVSKSLPLANLAHEIFNEQKSFINGSEIYPSSKLLSQLQSNKMLTFMSFKNIDDQDRKKAPPSYEANMPIIDMFQKVNGMKKLFDFTKENLQLISNQDIKNLWLLWIDEVESYSQLPGFLGMLLREENCKKLLFEMILNISESKPKSITQFMSLKNDQVLPKNKQLEAHQKFSADISVKTFKVLQDVFESSQSSKLRQVCVESGTLSRLIERLGHITKEKKRSKIQKGSKPLVEEEEKKDQSSKKNNGPTDFGKQPRVKKGIGYMASRNEKQWDVNDYLKSKDEKNQQAMNIIKMLTKFFKTNDWQGGEDVKNQILESSFLPTLEGGLRQGSLLEMVKQLDLQMAYLHLIQEFAQHQPQLLSCFQDIGDDYYPRQLDSICSLLQKIDDLAAVYLSFQEEIKETGGDYEKPETKPNIGGFGQHPPLSGFQGLMMTLQHANSDYPDDDGGFNGGMPIATENQPVNSEKPKELALEIRKTQQIVLAKLSEGIFTQKKKETVEDMLQMPLAEAYLKLLSPLRFDKANLKEKDGSYLVRYSGQPVKIEKPTPGKIVRLSQEIADLSRSLPSDHTNAIFCRVDKQRVDVMKFIIMGASGTPYAHGAFQYEMYFKNDYPNKPPVCSLSTTGGGSIRFNPNLYDTGYICLSILGTWRGNSPAENWDPKLSSIFQILLSIQATVMSSDVYFNEPGHEQEIGTPHGEALNNGFCNIIRYGNIKYAMIDMIDNPPPGFEKVILSNFYLKKNVILRDVKKWVDEASKINASYNGLVSIHNPQWAQLFSQPGKYAQMMKEIYEELQKKLDSIPSPFETQDGQKLERLFSSRDDKPAQNKPAQQKPVTINITQTKVQTASEEIDVSYDQAPQVNAELNINDEKVKDRWSRYIGALGIEAVAKQAQSRILICGMGALGIEIAKNIILAGCKEMIIYDSILPSQADLSGQFFLTEKDAQEKKQSRAHYSKDKLQQLNFYVKVTVLDLESPQKLQGYIESQPDLKVAVFTENQMFTRQELTSINNICRKSRTAFINTFQTGLFGGVFNDFGENFTVVDKNGEEPLEQMIKDISVTENGKVVVTVIGDRHKFEDSDVIQFKEVVGMKHLEDDKKSINNAQTINIRVINPQKFELVGLEIEKFSKYERGGIAKQVKVPFNVSHKTMQEIDSEKDHFQFFDPDLVMADFTKFDNVHILHWINKVAQTYPSLKNQVETLDKVLEAVPKDLQESQMKLIEKLVCIYYKTLKTYFAPISAFLGGFVSQEIVKAVTQKYKPIGQLFYYDLSEFYPDQEIAIKKDEEWANQQVGLSKDRYISLQTCIGKELLDKIHNCKVFMIGAGAIGCELLKNYAMLGLGITGEISLTDPDVIEVSNLNRQFLFREKHLRKPKSQTASAAAIQMNPDLKDKISARLDKVCDKTSHIYNEKFFKSQSIVMNALDNVQARLFIDEQCVSARTAMIDSGTLGPKGHVQVVVPSLKTESYASHKDPEDNNDEIPQCTLKMFPEETLHCVEWAKSIFGDLFTLKPQSFNKVIILEKDKFINLYNHEEKKTIERIIKTLEKMPNSFKDCIRLARLRFQKHFHNDIKQLLHIYPLDKLNDQGKPYWSLPKRPPMPVTFDPANKMHQNVIAAFACLYANMYQIKNPYDKPREEQAKIDMAMQASQVEVPEFVPDDEKGKRMKTTVEEEAKKGEEKESDDNLGLGKIPSINEQEMNQLQSKIAKLVEPIRKSQKVKLIVEEFEKDNDANYHIDFIHALTNVRAANYKLDEMDWITVKIKAGKIVPALATTTAAIAALQTIELIRFLKGSKIEEYKNSFLNLSVPNMIGSEVNPAKKIKLGSDGLEVTLWDRWEFHAPDRNVTLLDLVQHLEQTYKLEVRGIYQEAMPLYIYRREEYPTIMDRNEALEIIFLVDEALSGENEIAKQNVEHIDLTVTFVDPQLLAPKNEMMMIDTSSVPQDADQEVKDVPIVRVYLPKE